MIEWKQVTGNVEQRRSDLNDGYDLGVSLSCCAVYALFLRKGTKVQIRRFVPFRTSERFCCNQSLK